MRRSITAKLIGMLASGGLTLGACSAGQADFKAAAEKAIRTDVETNSGVAGKAVATCDDPSSTKVGTKFACVATAADGSTFTYSAEITNDKEVTVNFLALGAPTGQTGLPQDTLATPGT